jgi:hypothetical protein
LILVSSPFNEDTGQPTLIDLVLFDKNTHPKIFMESKLVEAEFGGCSFFRKGDKKGFVTDQIYRPTIRDSCFH